MCTDPCVQNWSSEKQMPSMMGKPKLNSGSWIDEFAEVHSKAHSLGWYCTYVEVEPNGFLIQCFQTIFILLLNLVQTCARFRIQTVFILLLFTHYAHYDARNLVQTGPGSIIFQPPTWGNLCWACRILASWRRSRSPNGACLLLTSRQLCVVGLMMEEGKAWESERSMHNKYWVVPAFVCQNW
jgi:hypothetical protein